MMLKSIRSLPLALQIILAMIIGIILGFSFGEKYMFVFYPLGELFIDALKMIIIPIIFTSVALGIINLSGVKSLGNISLKSFLLFSLTSLTGIVLSLFLYNMMKPGEGIVLDVFSSEAIKEGSFNSLKSGEKSIFQLLVNLVKSFVPTNIASAFSSNRSALSVIFLSVIFGLATLKMSSDTRRNTIKDLLEALNEIIFRVTNFIISLAPFGVFGLVVKASSQAGVELFQALGMYALTLVIGLSVHLFIILPLYLFIFGRVNPIKHFRIMLPALLMAFSTSSSGATLPLTMKTLSKDMKVPEKYSTFIPPLGATINMDGTSLYECLAVLFIAGILGPDLSLTEQILVVITAFFAGMGTAAVPSAGIVMIFIVLAAVGLDNDPRAGFIVGGLLAIDRPLDMYRTTVNVYSDSVVTTIVARSEGEKIETIE